MPLLSKITSIWISGASVQKISLHVHYNTLDSKVSTQVIPYWPRLFRNSFKKLLGTKAKDVPESGIRRVSVPEVLS